MSSQRRTSGGRAPWVLFSSRNNASAGSFHVSLTPNTSQTRKVCFALGLGGSARAQRLLGRLGAQSPCSVPTRPGPGEPPTLPISAGPPPQPRAAPCFYPSCWGSSNRSPGAVLPHCWSLLFGSLRDTQEESPPEDGRSRAPCWHPGPSPRRFRAENKFAKEIKA